MTGSWGPPPGDQPAGDRGGPRTKRVVRTEHRQPLLRNGIVCAAAGLATLIGGVAMFSLLQAAQVLSPIADADVGDSLTFDADGDESYALVLKRGEISDEGTVDRLVANTTCTILTSDGTTRTVDGSKQASSSQTDFGASLGSFTTPKGTTQVTCVGQGSRLVFDRYAVAPERKGAVYVSYGLIGVGLLLGLAGSSLIKRGWNGSTSVERVPV